jgi:hypothetical protein
MHWASPAGSRPCSARGEVPEVTRLVYEARENCLAHIRNEAEALQADAVIGIKLFVHELSRGLVEVMAIGTAIKRNSNVATQSEQLIPQAIVRDRDMFFDEITPPTPGFRERDLSRK